ncbi:MAG: glycosyltransferase, partial [candidate division WOR-3 bacterium]|nr:glycosyltransferase [candidate division WOR-3 bacterium]
MGIKLIEKYKEGHDIVYAKRNKRNGESLFKKVSAYMFYRVLNYLSDIEIPNDVGDFRLITR